MLVPRAGTDYLDQPAEAKTTFLTYTLELRYRPADPVTLRPRIELMEEALGYITKGEARNHLPFRHSTRWRDSVVAGRRTSPYISTAETGEPQGRVIKLHQDTSTGGGRTRSFQAEKLPRTVLSTVNAQESPTAVLARQEMLNWKLLQLEPSALRAPDGFDAPSQIIFHGSHLPATLHRLSQLQDRALTEIANRLSELIEQVDQVRVDRDEKREVLTLLLSDRYGTELPAKSLSDGTLRFIALASVEIDPTHTGLVCMEEPENGIHPERIGALLNLLQDIAVDTSMEVADDNPLRQVIVNTHSPVVVQQVPDDAIVFAVPESRLVSGHAIKGVGFRCLSDTWRSQAGAMQTMAKGKALAFLNPVARRDATSHLPGATRVVDRTDLQMELPF